MNPNTIKRYKRISNWLLVLAVILFIAGIAILVGPVIIQENEMNTAAQEYEKLVEDNLTDSDLDSIVPTAEFLTDSDINISVILSEFCFPATCPTYAENCTVIFTVNIEICKV